jgi:SH3 domain-containing protein
MIASKPIQIFAGVLVLAGLACNLGLPAPAPSDPRDAAGTIVAMTLQAQGLPTSAGLIAETPTSASPVPPTPTFSRPILYINQNANCREGPGNNYKVVTSFTAGTSVDMLAKDSADSYWVIQIPGGTDTCWVAAEFASPGGDYQGLPEVTPEAAAKDVPARPGSLYFNYYCDNTSVTTTLTWADIAGNENGYRVYRLGALIADLPANTTTYTDTAEVAFGTPLTFSVEAYNEVGPSPQRTVNFTCQ